MADPRLICYAETITKLHKFALKKLREETGDSPVWISIEFPEITLILSGLVLSGRVISCFEYLKRSRDFIASSQNNESTKQSISALFIEPTRLLDDEENTKAERIYLVSVTVISGGVSSYLDHPVSIQLDSVQGWTIGGWTY